MREPGARDGLGLSAATLIPACILSLFTVAGTGGFLLKRNGAEVRWLPVREWRLRRYEVVGIACGGGPSRHWHQGWAYTLGPLWLHTNG
jgi:hypothetical protein